MAYPSQNKLLTELFLCRISFGIVLLKMKAWMTPCILKSVNTFKVFMGKSFKTVKTWPI